MAAGSVALPKFSWDSLDQAAAFKEWKSLLSSYFVIGDVADAKQWHYILLSTGQKGHELMSSWGMTDDQKKDPNAVFKKFEDHLVGTPNKWVTRLEFAELSQKDDESIDDFI